MTTLTNPNAQATFDDAKADAFAERFVAALNESATIVMLSIGHRTGLFDTMDGLAWSTSGEIAEAANLDERYVREWLGAMVTSRVIDYRPADKTYRLPAEHARWLTRRATPENLAVTAQWLGVIAGVETDVIEKFKTGGGVHYHCFHRFHETMAEESSQTVVAGLQDHILPLVPELRKQLEAGIDVLEIGCGSGRALASLGAMFPKSRFLGYDLCDDAIAAAKREAQQRGVSNVTFQTKDITTMDQHSRFDLALAFDVIHDQKDPATVLDNVHAALKPGGTFLMQDIAGSSYLEKNMDHPLAPFTYTISTMHCMTVSLAQGGAGLGTMWGEELAERMLNDAGFTLTRKQKLPHDILNVYYVWRKN